MPSPHDELRAAGIELAADRDRPALPECTRLARRMRERRVRAIGLAPAADDVAVPAVAIELGRALAATGATLVGVFDAQGSWPAARALVEADHGEGPLATSWLLDNLALLTPRALRPGAALDRLRDVVADQVSAPDHLVVDLTGFDHLGEHLAAFQLLDGVAVVARSGRTTTRQIERWLRDLPGGRGLGVLLTGL